MFFALLGALGNLKPFSLSLGFLGFAGGGEWFGGEGANHNEDDRAIKIDTDRTNEVKEARKSSKKRNKESQNDRNKDMNKERGADHHDDEEDGQLFLHCICFALQCVFALQFVLRCSFLLHCLPSWGD